MWDLIVSVSDHCLLFTFYIVKYIYFLEWLKSHQTTDIDKQIISNETLDCVAVSRNRL